jgi:hypothetical protein
MHDYDIIKEEWEKKLENKYAFISKLPMNKRREQQLNDYEEFKKKYFGKIDLFTNDSDQYNIDNVKKKIYKELELFLSTDKLKLFKNNYYNIIDVLKINKNILEYMKNSYERNTTYYNREDLVELFILNLVFYNLLFYSDNKKTQFFLFYEFDKFLHRYQNYYFIEFHNLDYNYIKDCYNYELANKLKKKKKKDKKKNK